MYFARNLHVRGKVKGWCDAIERLLLEGSSRTFTFLASRHQTRKTKTNIQNLHRSISYSLYPLRSSHWPIICTCVSTPWKGSVRACSSVTTSLDERERLIAISMCAQTVVTIL